MIMCDFFSCLPRRGVDHGDEEDVASASASVLALVSSLRDQHPVPVLALPLSAPNPDPSIDLASEFVWCWMVVEMGP